MGQRPELLYLRFNAGGGSVTNDFAQPGFPGTSVTLQGGASWNSVDQKFGGSCLDTRVSTGAGAMCRTNSPVNYSGDWTIEAWVKKIDNRSDGFFLGTGSSLLRIRNDSFWGSGNLALSRMANFIASAKKTRNPEPSRSSTEETIDLS